MYNWLENKSITFEWIGKYSIFIVNFTYKGNCVIKMKLKKKNRQNLDRPVQSNISVKCLLPIRCLASKICVNPSPLVLKLCKPCVYITRYNPFFTHFEPSQLPGEAKTEDP